ncbi:hypothetical protein H9L10_04525 [Phycicoccus endophyticus]|uniref:Uncharacterized protein n=1 Tax=Phycicoccus endophyticus TaxID=1690220 RepID=A0A7G9R3Y1_9MICO|nr:hypothetical protein [Phycicoccus endophyticus]NHI18140.1 hypothetical protein [Phycicoccus endophyticus]QNN50306.1 hypothetical protein H9L10_04525 [Phycicoccus endophyticus]GGL26141.1 hypothetical protein GCM10012283_05390 [Phycicoccus endophyticus]
MRLLWTGLRRPAVPGPVVAAIGPSAGERLLAWGAAADGRVVVAGRHALHAVAPGPDDGLALVLSRPWHLVDAGTMSAEGRLEVTWVDGEAPLRVTLETAGSLPETLRERVQASVVLTEALDLGVRRTARVVVRRDLASGALLSQAVLGPGVRSSDPGVAEQVRAGLRRVREEVGLE